MAESPGPPGGGRRAHFQAEGGGGDGDSPNGVVNISSPSDLPLAALAAWHDLPQSVRDDPYLSPFRRGYERHIGTAAGVAAAAAPTSPTPGPSSAPDPAPAPAPAPATNAADSPAGDARRPHATQDPASGEDISLSMSFMSSYTQFAEQPTSTERDNQRVSSRNAPLSPIPEDLPLGDHGDTEGPRKRSGWKQCLKITLLTTVWAIFTVTLMLTSEKEITIHQISIPENDTRTYWILDQPLSDQLSITIQGALLPPYYSNMSSKSLSIWVQVLEQTENEELVLSNSSVYDKSLYLTENISDAWIIPLVSNKDLIDFVPEVTTTKRFFFKGINVTSKDPESLVARIQMSTNMEASFPIALSYDLTPIDTYKGQIYGGVVLFGLYGLIITETVHRALAAIVASTMSVAILAAMNERPTMHELVSWIDIETLLLLFSMMVLVAILAETGIFDSLAVYAYQITNGRVWPLVNTLCLFTAALSSFLDNVTTVLLMTPVTIRLCEVTELNPVPILMSMTMFSNIGGALTPVGDPPNAIIASHPDIRAAGIDFGVFTLHMGVGVILALISINIFLRLKFKNISDLRFTEPQDIQELRHEIAIWKRAAASLSTYSKDEDIVRRTLLLRVKRLTTDLKRKLNTGSVAIDTYKATLEELKAKYPIRDKVLLIKSGLALCFVIVLFFLHSIPQLKLSLGWTALLGAILLLLLTADNEIMESVLNRIEWGTLLFFAALFVLMEALSRLGLIELVGSLTERFVLSLPVNARLSGSIVFILGISAMASSFVDNIPLTTMMIRIVTSLAQNTDINLPLQPLVWALAFGACLGGNGTLIGSSANMVCAGVAEQHGYKFTFIQYFKLGFPVTTISVIGAGIYLLIAHVVFTWHDQ